MIQGLPCGHMAFGLVSAACGGDEVCEENLERLRLLQLEFVWIEPGVLPCEIRGYPGAVDCCDGDLAVGG